MIFDRLVEEPVLNAMCDGAFDGLHVAGSADNEARWREATQLALIEATLEARGASITRGHDGRILDRPTR